MHTAEKISITMTREMLRLIRETVEAGEYASTSEVVRDAMRAWQRERQEHAERLNAIRERIRRSLDDPRPDLSADEAEGEIYSPAFVAASKAQAIALKAGAEENGLRFDAYLVPSVAAWVLGEIERGRFLAPGDAVFVAMQVFMELEAYPDLREELLRREIEKSIADPRPGIPAEEVFAKLNAKMQQARQEPPSWQRLVDQS